MSRPFPLAMSCNVDLANHWNAQLANTCNLGWGRASQHLQYEDGFLDPAVADQPTRGLGNGPVGDEDPREGRQTGGHVHRPPVLETDCIRSMAHSSQYLLVQVGQVGSTNLG